jgi:hypothetical protein
MLPALVAGFVAGFLAAGCFGGYVAVRLPTVSADEFPALRELPARVVAELSELAGSSSVAETSATPEFAVVVRLFCPSAAEVMAAARPKPAATAAAEKRRAILVMESPLVRRTMTPVARNTPAPAAIASPTVQSIGLYAPGEQTPRLTNVSASLRPDLAEFSVFSAY